MNIQLQSLDVARAVSKVMARMQRARDDVRVYTETVCRDDHGNAIALEPIHQQWFRHVDYCWTHGLRALIMAPFGHGKTSSLSVPLMSWIVGNDPNTRIKLVTNDDASASKRIMACKRIIESPGFRQVFPTVRKGDRWTDHELYVRRAGMAVDPTVHARGVFTTGIGGRADYMFFDDVVDQKNATDAAQRKRVLDLVEQTWMSRLEPDARVLMIGTAWHQGDTSHVLLHRAGWCALVQRVSEDCSCIDQEVYGAKDGYPISG